MLQNNRCKLILKWWLLWSGPCGKCDFQFQNENQMFYFIFTLLFYFNLFYSSFKILFCSVFQKPIMGHGAFYSGLFQTVLPK